MRTITVSGNLAANAEIKIAQNNHAYMTFNIANEEVDDSSGVMWFHGITFDPSLMVLCKYLTKGKFVTVTGRYRDGIYINKDKEYSISREIRVLDIGFACSHDRPLQKTPYKQVFKAATLEPLQDTLSDEAHAQLPF